jgi:IS4 transposase
MNHGRTIFAQILDGLDSKEFQRCASLYPTLRHTHALSAYDHFAAMIFAQLTCRESLRDIEACLNARRGLLYHSGIRGNVTRTNLSYANEHRDAQLFAALAAVLMRRARKLYAGSRDALDLDGELFAIDSTLIDLSMALFPWARWQGTQAALKLNTVLAVAAELPDFCTLVDGGVHDVNFLDDIDFRPGSYYALDRGYVDYKRLKKIHQAGAWFVTRAKSNMSFYVVQSRRVDKASGLRCDQTIRLKGAKARRNYPEPLRRICYYDAQTQKQIVFLTNNFVLPALIIAAIYKRRWEIELFFRWIKQHLRLRGFYSNSRNGVAAQIWTALCAHLLVAIAQRELALPGSLHRTLQIISVSALEKVPLPQLVAKDDTSMSLIDIPIQLTLNGF